MEKALDKFNVPATQPGGQSDNSIKDGSKKRRVVPEAPVTISNAAEYPRGTHRVPYDPSELVISTSEGPSQRYPLVHQACAGMGGLDYTLLRKSSDLCSETLIKDMYIRIEALDEKVRTLTTSLEQREKLNSYLQKRLDYLEDIHGSLLINLSNVCALKDKAEICMANYAEMRPPEREPVPLISDDLDTQPTDTVDDVSAILDVAQLLEDRVSGLRVRVLGKHMVRVPISASGHQEKPLHGMHILPEDDGVYYFQKQLLNIINSILPKRLKISSLGVWNYTIRNFKTEALQAATWDDSMEAMEAKDLARGPKGVILLTHDTMKGVIDSLTDRTQGNKKWDRVPGRVNKQIELKNKTDDLAAELKRVTEIFHSLLESDRDGIQECIHYPQPQT
jgi:hypothetical protein